MTTPTRLLTMIGVTMILLYTVSALPAPPEAHLTPQALAAPPQSTRAPLDLVIVLDASGSMNWTWDGYGTLSNSLASELAGQVDSQGVPFLSAKYQPDGVGAGKPFWCAAPDVLARSKGCQSADAWSNYQERRLYQAKQAIKVFLEQFTWQPDDRAAVVTYNGYLPSGSTAPDPLATLTHIYPTNGLTSTITGGPGSLADVLINQAATTNPGSADMEALYKTIGASPGALGLQRSQRVLQAPEPDCGRQRAVLFFADGVLNVNLEGIRTPFETVAANTGPGKPVTQAVEVAAAIKNDATWPAAVFVVALGANYDATWMRAIASSPSAPFFQSSADAANLPAMLDALSASIAPGVAPCAELSATPTDTATPAAPATATATTTATAIVTATATATATAAAPGGTKQYGTYFPFVRQFADGQQQ